MIAGATFAAAAIIAVGAALWWYLDSRTVMVVASLLACAAVASAFVFRPAAMLRSGYAIEVDDSCDAAKVTPTIAAAIRNTLAPGVNGDAAVVLSWFSYDAQTTRRIILDLTAALPSSIRGDAVAFANWKAPRAQEAARAMARLRTKPCQREGTSIVGAAEAANAELAQAGVRGHREIVLVTNLVEFSRALKIQIHWFGPTDITAAVRAIAKLPPPQRVPLGKNTTVRIVFVPIVRDHGRDMPIGESAAVALETWAKRVFRTVLHAGSVHIDVVPTNG